MGEYTQYPRASYTASDPDALIEILRRVPDTGMLIDLNEPDTERMIGWLTEAERANYLAQASRWHLYKLHFEQHLDFRRGGTERPLNHWPDDMTKIFLVAWWTMISTDNSIESNPEINRIFGQRSLDMACTSYNSFAEVLDVELV